MRNIFLFIRRYSHLLVFLLFQGFAIFLIFQYSKYHKAVFSATANEVTGNINTRYNKVEYYFLLKKVNDSLLKANEMLYNKLKENYELPDTVTRKHIDSLRVDSVMQYRQYSYLSAKVVSNSVTAQNNYLILSGGKKKGFHEGMGVIDPNNAAVGVITEVTDDYAVVMSLLHKDSHLSGKLLKSGETGTLSWDGKVPNLITIQNISKSAKVAIGDTIITSGFSTSFPKGIYIGRIAEVLNEKSTNNFKIRFRTMADFHTIQFVYAIENIHQEPVNKLLDKLKQQP